MSGEVVGVNTAIVSATQSFAGLGFALPSNTAVQVYNQLVATGKVTRGGIGITYTNRPEELRALGVTDGAGVVVQGVSPGLPADRAGIRPFDVITEVNGRKITTSDVLLNTIANSPIGSTITVKILRDGQPQTLPITIGDRQEVIADVGGRNGATPRGGQGGESAETSLGVTVQALTPQMEQQLGLDAQGVAITAVEPGSAAEEAGLTRGMVITGMFVNGRRTAIRNMADFRTAERSLRSGQELGLIVMVRSGTTGDYRQQLVAIRVP
jgi:serine protease Do